MLWVLGFVLDYCIGFGMLLCFGIIVLVCWEVLCVLRDLRVDFGRWVEKWVESVGGGGVYGIRCGVSCCLLKEPSKGAETPLNPMITLLEPYLGKDLCSQAAASHAAGFSRALRAEPWAPSPKKGFRVSTRTFAQCRHGFIGFGV